MCFVTYELTKDSILCSPLPVSLRIYHPPSSFPGGVLSTLLTGRCERGQIFVVPKVPLGIN